VCVVLFFRSNARLGVGRLVGDIQGNGNDRVGMGITYSFYINNKYEDVGLNKLFTRGMGWE
jgi:hypothetical protein